MFMTSLKKVDDSTTQKESNILYKEVMYYYCPKCKQEISNYRYNENQDAVCNSCNCQKLSTHKPIINDIKL